MNDNQVITFKPLEKQIKVRLEREAAFQLFTKGFSKWWPLLTHSVGEELAETCVFEGKVGGRIYEVMKDGRQADWGNVLVWEPFEKVVYRWYPSRTPETAQEVTVEFMEIPGGTRVELVQAGWDIHGDQAQASREGYDFGWDFVLANYIIASTNK